MYSLNKYWVSSLSIAWSYIDGENTNELKILPVQNTQKFHKIGKKKKKPHRGQNTLNS